MTKFFSKKIFLSMTFLLFFFVSNSYGLGLADVCSNSYPKAKNMIEVERFLYWDEYM